MSAGLATKAIDRLEHLRWLVPPRRVSRVVTRRVDSLWQDERYRAAQEAQMRYLLEYTDRVGEASQLARAYAEFQLGKTYTRWHPHDLVNQRVRGIEWLTTGRDPERCTILSFMHHNHYEGLFASLARVGAPCHVLALPSVLGEQVPTGMRQHIKVVHTDSIVIPAAGGLATIQGHATAGRILAIAADVPGHTPAVFLGRKVLAPFGTALIATRTNSPIVFATARRDAEGGYVQLDPPVEPSDFATPDDLLQAILDRHGEAVLAWPEVLDMPRARWGTVEE